MYKTYLFDIYKIENQPLNSNWNIIPRPYTFVDGKEKYLI